MTDLLNKDGLTGTEPRSVFSLCLHVTDRCNLRCRYCYIPRAGNVTMKPSEAISLAREVLERSFRRVFVHFTGGEPLLCWEMILPLMRAIGEQADAAGKTGPEFSIQTNGLLLDQRRYAALREHGVSLCLSLDGNTVTNDRNRVDPGGLGSFRRVLVDSVPREERARVAVTLVLTPETVSELVNSVAFLSELGFLRIVPKVNLLARWDCAARKDAEIAYWRLSEWYSVRRRLQDGVIIVPFLDYARSTIHAWPDAGCAEGRAAIALAPDGRRFPCSLWWALSLRGLGEKMAEANPARDCGQRGCGVVRCGANCRAYAVMGPQQRDLVCWYSRLLDRVARRVAAVAAAEAGGRFRDAVSEICENYARCYWA